MTKGGDRVRSLPEDFAPRADYRLPERDQALGWGDHYDLGQIIRMASVMGVASVQAVNRWSRPLPWGLFALWRDKAGVQKPWG